MLDEKTKESYTVIIVCFGLLVLFSFLAGQIYLLFVMPSFGLRYANIFFMISFTIIFFSLVYLYHIWMIRYKKSERES
jgi:hypothetical protein